MLPPENTLLLLSLMHTPYDVVPPPEMISVMVKSVKRLLLLDSYRKMP
jgi:hypothetical protein